MAHDCSINWDPKPFDDVNGSGCHVNYSDRDTRADRGVNAITEKLGKMGRYHSQNVKNWGSNEKRLSGLFETSSPDHFTYAFGARNVSCRIPNEVAFKGYGYFENRIPASDMNPYIVFTTMLQ